MDAIHFINGQHQINLKVTCEKCHLEMGLKTITPPLNDNVISENLICPKGHEIKIELSVNDLKPKLKDVIRL